MRIFSVLQLLILLSISSITYGQDSFTGMLEYKISIRDTAMRSFVPDNRMIVYTNDTITRIENFTSRLGKQVVIHHMVLNKSYMLLDTPVGKFAIQTDHNKKDSIGTDKGYTLDKKCGKEKILGYKAKKMIVKYDDMEEDLQFLYLKQYSNKYLNNFEDSPGLLVKYSLPTEDGILDYELIRISEYAPDRDLFGIPSDYERVSFDEFLKRFLNQTDKEENKPEEEN